MPPVQQAGLETLGGRHPLDTVRYLPCMVPQSLRGLGHRSLDRSAEPGVALSSLFEGEGGGGEANSRATGRPQRKKAVAGA